MFNVVTGVPAKYNMVFKRLIQKIADAALGSSFTARYPNPFKGVNGPMGFDGSKSDDLAIVDGGESSLIIGPLPLADCLTELDFGL